MLLLLHTAMAIVLTLKVLYTSNFAGLCYTTCLPGSSTTPARTDKQGVDDAGFERSFFGAPRTSVFHVDPEASNAAPCCTRWRY